MNENQYYEWLTTQLEQLKPRTKFFNTIKNSLKSKGYWKNQPRGKGDSSRFVTAKYHGEPLKQKSEPKYVPFEE